MTTFGAIRSKHKTLCVLLIPIVLLLGLCAKCAIPSETSDVERAAISNRQKILANSTSRQPPWFDLRNSNSSSILARQASGSSSSSNVYRIHVAAIHIDRAEFPLSKLLFRLTLQLALESVNKQLEPSRAQLTLSVRSANTCSRQFAGAVAAEEYYTKRARLFVVSGCDAAIRGVSRLASAWRVPVLTAAGFGLDLNDKSIHRTLVRVAFSLQSAVEFLVKILKSFQWRRVNLIVDESDPNSSALRSSIERHLIEFSSNNSKLVAAGASATGAALESASSELPFEVSLNSIPIDLQTLTSLTIEEGKRNTSTSNRNNLNLPSSAAKDESTHSGSGGDEDKWPNSITEAAIQDALRQSSLYSRVNILLIPQNYLRKFMLSVHDQGMANGLYTFINMPLLLLANENQQQTSDSMPNTAAGSTANSTNPSKQSYTTSTGKNVFAWRERNSPRNPQAKQAFESLMSIYLRTPTSKAYVYFASRLSNFANLDSTTNLAAKNVSAISLKSTGQRTTSSLSKIQLSIDPYSASFYDCLQVYAVALQDSLLAIASSKAAISESSVNRSDTLRRNFHAYISDQLRNRRFENMVTGTILINENGDRDTEYTLDDLNQMTGKFSPVILYKSDSKQMVRLARIQWSSDESGECHDVCC